MPRINCFDKIKNKEVKILQQAFNDLVPVDTDLSEQEQKEIGKKIALDYYNQVNQELADLKESVKSETPTIELPEALNRIMDKSITIGDNYYSGKIKSIEKTKRGYAVTDSKGQTVNVIFDKGILLSDEIQGDMSGVIPPYRPVAVQTSDGWQTVRKTTSEIQQEINEKREKVEKIEDEAEKEIKQVDPKIPPSKLPVKARVAQRKVRDEKAAEDIKAKLLKLKNMGKGGITLTSGGFDPQKFELATEIIAAYIKEGVYKFSDIIEDAYAAMGEGVKELYDMLKTAYGGYYMAGADQMEAEQMDLSQRNLTFDEITHDMSSEEVEVEDFEKVENSESRRQFIDAVKEKIKNQEKQNIVSLRKLAAELGIDVVDTNLQEMVEMAVVELSRDMANKSWQEKYILEGIIDIYDNQPTISMRSANRIELQQYSTPAPTAYIAGLYVAAGKPGSVFEPSAGNGITTIAFKPEIVSVNEIDPVRLDNLAGQGFKQVTDQDALQPFPKGKKYDGLVMNPPFGSSEQIEVNGYKISGLAQKMAINALQNLASNGRAAIIIGGHNEYDDKGRITSERTFFNWLYNQYNVAAVINISGELYAKQGTQFPTRLILIHSKKAVAEGATPINKAAFKPFDFWTLPGHGDQFILANGKKVTITQVKGATKLHYALDDMPITDKDLIKFLNDNKAISTENAAQVVTSFYDLLKIVNSLKDATYENILQPGLDANRNDGDAIHGKGADQLQPDNEGGLPPVSTGQVRPNNSGRASSKGNTGLNNGNVEGANPSESDTNRISADDNADGRISDLPADVSEQQQHGAGDNRAGGIGNIRGNQPVQSARKFEAGELSENEKVPYVPKSSSQSVDTVIPNRMATDAENVLTEINNEYGGIDNFVQQKLGYKTKEQLFNALSGEQVDAVAMTIKQIENGQAMIIGDQTGVGKGRVAAAIIRYSILKGYKPIFLTQDAELFSDLYRDLVDIDPDPNAGKEGSWSRSMVPFIFNDKGVKDPTITDAQGNVVHKLIPVASKKSIYKSGKLPENTKFVLASYSQFGTSSDKPSVKKDFFRNIADGTILILDESHNVAGESNRGEYFKEIIATSKGVLYLSATFAKSPKAMPVYAMKTAMQEANMSSDELVRAIEHGGVALQEVIAAQLVESGQMLRRERSFKGVSVDYEILKETGPAHREIADKVTEIIRDIIEFQATHIAEVITAMDDIAAAAGARMTPRGGTNQAGINNTPFASKVFNVIDQLLFAIKALDSADAAIEELKANRKPVIGFKSTMQSFLNHIGAQVGERLEKIDFSLTLKRALEGVMRYSEKDAQGKSNPGTLSLADLSEQGREEYQRILDKILKASSGITVSPIDVIRKRIQDAGYTVKEITGRNIMLDIQDDGSAIVTTRFDTDKKKIVREFNDGELDVILLNMSGATGISMHASSKFKDQRQRVMIDVQLELDINAAVQKRGRIDRVGQVVRGAYRYIVSDIPAESRLLMMFKKKLKSLDANTTSSQKSIKTADIADFLNKYGDEIVTEYLKENRELNDKLLDPLKFNDKSDEDLDGITKIEDAALKVTGKVAILPTQEQNEFYKEVSERYTDYIEYLESNNSNDLEVKVLPLNAKTLTSDIIVEGRGGDSPFGNPSILEQIETDVLKKPLKKEDIDKEVKEGLDGVTPEQKSEEVLNGIEGHYDGVIEQGIAKLEAQHEKNKISVARNAREKAIENKSADVEGDVAGALERLEFAKNEAIKRLEARNNFVKSNLSRMARYFKIGNLYEVPISVRTDTTVGTSKGIFLGFNIKKNRKNPYAPSAINMRFAVNDSRRIVSIPLSKNDFINAVIANSSFLTPQARQNYIDNWDSLQSTRTRENRFMVTGNLLQAYGTNDGQLVSYTDEQGNLLKGILLPESYKVQEQKRRIAINQAAPYLEKRGSFITTVDRDVVIKKEGTGYTITVPLTKKAGGKYFLNKGLQALVNERGFNQMAGKMTAYFSDSKLQDILDFLYREYNSSIEVDSKINKAELRKEEKVEPEPDVVEEDKDEDFVEVLVQRAKDEFPNVPEAFFGPYRNLLATELLPNIPPGSIHRHLLKRMSQFQVNTPETQAMHDVIELASRMIDAKEDDSNDMFLHDDKELGDHFLINAWGETAKVSLQDKRSYRDFGDQYDKELGPYFEMPLEFATGVNQEDIFNSYLFFRDAYNFFRKSNPDFSVSEPVSEDVQDLIDVIQEEVDNGLLSLTALQDKVAKELEDDSQELRNQVAEAYNEYTKRFTPDEINQAINQRISDNLSAVFGGTDNVVVLNDEDVMPKVRELSGGDGIVLFDVNKSGTLKNSEIDTTKYFSYDVNGISYGYADIKMEGRKFAVPVRFGTSDNWTEISQEYFDAAKAYSQYLTGQPYEGMEKQYKNELEKRKEKFETYHRQQAEIIPVDRRNTLGGGRTTSDIQKNIAAEEELVLKEPTVEYKATEELLDQAKAEYQTAKKAFETKRKQLDKAIQADQQDLFGDRPTSSLIKAPGLFDERVSQSGRDKAMEPFKARMVKAEKEVNRLQKKLNGLGNQTAQTSLFQVTMPNGTTKNVKPVDVDVVNGFYSPLEKTINEFKGDKLPAKQWADKFAKGEEAKWTGLTDWLNQQTGSVSKADIQQYLKDNRIEVVEVVKDGEISEEEIDTLLNDEVGQDMTRDEARAFLENDERQYDTKFSEYQLEGEKENYKDVLVTMPSKGYLKERWGVFDNKGKLVSSYNSEVKAKEKSESIGGTYRMASNVGEADPKVNFKSSHFDEPNILVHLRMNTRVDAEGKKVLFLEEVQSDWGQKGKKEGFEIKEEDRWNFEPIKRNGETVAWKIELKSDKNIGGIGNTKEDAIKDANKRYGTEINTLEKQQKGTPSAPFVTDTNAWTKLGLKVALKEAVKQGADKIAWTTGEQQNDRYDLSKQVQSIEVEKVEEVPNLFFVDINMLNETATYNLEVENGIVREGTYKGQRLEDIVGKDVAEKILNNGSQTLRGDNLKVGGKGMKGFYGSPSENSLGIVGNVAKSLFKQEPKTVEIKMPDSAPSNEVYFNDWKTVGTVGGFPQLQASLDDVDYEIGTSDGKNYTLWMGETKVGVYGSVQEAQKAAAGRETGQTTTQHSVDITPEMKAQVQGGQPLFMKSPEGKVLGFTHNGKIYLNGKHLNPNTPIHEAGHLHLEWLKQNNVPVYNRGIELISGSAYLDKVKNNPFYINEAAKLNESKREEFFQNEALATAIGDKGAQFVTEAKKKGFAEWLKNLWETIKNALGLENITAKELSELTLDEFAKRAAADILREKEQQEEEPEMSEEEQQEEQEQQDWENKDSIADYQMTTSGEVADMISGKTITSVFGEAPEGDQSYNKQKLVDMLQDGKNMIGAAMGKWGTDIADYGKPLFDYIKKMSSDKSLMAKKTVLMATFLGEIKEEIYRNPERMDELRPLENAVTAYYQDYMMHTAKSLSAGAILRIYRDKYMGDIFAHQILEEQEIRDQNTFRKLQAEQMDIDARVAAGIEEFKAVTQAEKDAADAEAAEKANDAKVKQKNKKNMAPTDAQKAAAAKAAQIKKNGRLDSIVDRIKNAINKCK